MRRKYSFIMEDNINNDMKKKLVDLYREGLIPIIKSDLAKLCEPTFFNGLKIYIFPRGTVFRFDVWFRIVQWSRLKPFRKISIGFLSYLVMRHYEYKYGIHINPNIYVGKGLHIMHGDGVFLNCKYIGDNFTVYQGVTLGSSHKGIPTVFDNVTVYTNSVICGEITLGNDVIVGAQAFLDKNVPDGEFWAGVPAKKN